MVSSLLFFLGKHLKYKAEGVTGKMDGCHFYLWGMVAARNVMLGEGKFRFNEFSLIAAKYLKTHRRTSNYDSIVFHYL